MNNSKVASPERPVKRRSNKVTPQAREVIFARVRRHLSNETGEISSGDFLAVLHECGYGYLTVEQAEGLTKKFFEEEVPVEDAVHVKLSSPRSGSRISLKRRGEIVVSLIKSFERSGAKPTLGAVAAALKDLKYTNLNVKQIKIIRDEFLARSGLPELDNLRTDIDLHAIAREFAHHFVQHTQYRPRRSEIFQLCESKGYEVPYWRTAMLRSLVIQAAPALGKRPSNLRNQRKQEKPKPLNSDSGILPLSHRLNVQIADFLGAYAGARGFLSSYRKKAIEELTLMVAYGLVSGKFNIAAMLPAALNMSQGDLEIAAKILERNTIKGV
ncbi:hypothetical protein [Noviherbaspirillum malthae]|uniref:hypothetical protein n=1 Tax=Noviherbaspirillum malthae TaxID=1260987 RepID=UPI00188E5172|nr:hypothetical protein [Noviherbaspirillum malthae]